MSEQHPAVFFSTPTGPGPAKFLTRREEFNCPIFDALVRIVGRMHYDPQYLRGKYVHKNKNKRLRRHPMRAKEYAR